MNPSEYNALHILHVFSVIAVVASVFFAVAAPAETRKRLLTWSGIVALLALLTGIRMWQGIYQWHANWVWVKIACWLGLGALTGLAYRKREKAGVWIALALAFAGIALVMVYAKPF